jgi:hypothetical protein
MKKNSLFNFLLVILILITTVELSAQIAFTNSNAKLKKPSFRSGGPVTVIDWNNDGRDDIVRLQGGGSRAYVEVQKANGTFDSVYLGSFSTTSGWAWAMAVADVDKNGYKDIIAGGNSTSVRILMTNSTGTGATLVNLPSSAFFLQNLTMGDFNNDGWIDIFACDDNAESHIYLNNGAGVFNISTTTMDFDVTTTDDSGNYGSVWTDFDNDGDLDLYVAKCRQSVTSPTDGRRINTLFVNDGAGNFTEMAATYGLAIGWQSWTAAFGDIDNDADMDLMLTNHDHESQILRNDGTGHYTDITATTGFDITDITPIQSMMEDFDNDGLIDIMVSGSAHRLYRNMGGSTFSLVTGIFDNNNMLSFATGDLNHDGFIDLYSSYGRIYVTPSGSTDDVLWLNNKNANHFITFNLEGVASNRDAIGTKVWIYGAWGVQVREVRNGESYGTVNSQQVHFGIGTNTLVDSVVIAWPSGTRQVILNPAVDQFVSVKEGVCTSPPATVSASGSTVLCPGNTVTLSAPAGYTYLWNTGASTQSITVSTIGDYNVEVTQAGNTCKGISRTVYVGPPQAETNPTITAAGDLLFCNGGSVTLNAPSGYTTYDWSNGESTSSIVVSTSGAYSVEVNGLCNMLPSNTINVDVITATAPTAPGTTIIENNSTTITATGSNITWYPTSTGGTALGTGNTYTTPILTSDATYYMQSSTTVGGGIVKEGMINHSGTSSYSGSNNTNGLMFFDVTEPCTLKTIKVYSDLDGTRKFELRNSSGTILQSTSVNITLDTQIVTLNWPLVIGTDYTIGTDSTTNMAIPTWGNKSPRFKRNSSGVSFPYNVSGAVSITNSSFGNTYYFYSYDWNIEKQSTTCYSAYVPVTITVIADTTQDTSNVGINATPIDLGISFYPNPSTTQFTIINNDATEVGVKIFSISGNIIKEFATLSKETIVNVSDIAKGMYLMEVTKNNQKVNCKLMIE